MLKMRQKGVLGEIKERKVDTGQTLAEPFYVFRKWLNNREQEAPKLGASLIMGLILVIFGTLMVVASALIIFAKGIWAAMDIAIKDAARLIFRHEPTSKLS